MIVKVNLQGEVLEAAEGYRPSTETKMHLRIYNELPEMNGVVHAHPRMLPLLPLKVRRSIK